MSGLPGPHGHRPRTAAPPGPRRPARTHLGTAWNLSSMREDVYDLARLAGAVRAFQLALPPAGASPQAIPLSKPHRTAKIRRVLPIHPRYADGLNVAYLASVAGCKRGTSANAL